MLLILLQAHDSIRAIAELKAGVDPSGSIVVSGTQIISVLSVFAGGYVAMYLHMRKDAKENRKDAKEHAVMFSTLAKANVEAFSKLTATLEETNRIQQEHSIIARETVDQVRKNSELIIELKHKMDIFGERIHK